VTAAEEAADVAAAAVLGLLEEEEEEAAAAVEEEEEEAVVAAVKKEDCEFVGVTHDTVEGRQKLAEEHDELIDVSKYELIDLSGDEPPAAAAAAAGLTMAQRKRRRFDSGDGTLFPLECECGYESCGNCNTLEL
jgi:archaellum component FlaD/FlaE